MSSPSADDILVPKHRAASPWLPLLVFGIALLTFSPVLSWPFVHWDDYWLVALNPDLRADHWRTLLRYWDPRFPHHLLYIPLTYSVWFILACAGELTTGTMEPALFHAANLAIHLVGGWLVWRLLNRLTEHRIASAFGTAVYLLHPIQAEPVCWIASLSTVMAGTLAVAAIGCYVGSIDGGARSRMNFVAACALFALALFAKPSVAGLPLAAMAIDRFILRQPWRRVLPRVAVLGLIAVPSLIVGRLAQPSSAVPIVPLMQRGLVAVDTLGFYLVKVLVPSPLAIDYGRTPVSVHVGDASTLLDVGIVIAAVAFSLLQLRRRPWILGGLLIFLAGVGPVLGIVPFTFQKYSTVADRYAYPSMLGVAIVVAMALRELRPTPAAIRVGLVVCGIYAILAHVQVWTWRSDTALYTNAYRVNPDSLAGHTRYAILKMLQAQQPETKPSERIALIAEAATHYRRAIELNPNNAEAQCNYGSLILRYANPSTPAEAIEHFEAASASAEHPDDLADDRAPLDPVTLHLNWGVALAQLNRLDEALTHLTIAKQANPNSPDVWASTGAVLARLGRNAEAQQAFAHALSIDPQQPQALKGLQNLNVNSD